ncbi:MAG: PadR family transcriptional regulator [Acidimicrobiales bacterium]|nr:MAG: PadR family transcriptional regulator [Acidimicrobiales bacterium]
MLEMAILGLLKEQPLHGYELKKRLGEILGVLSGVSFGSLYPALARLEGTGGVEAVAAEEGSTTNGSVVPERIPMTGSLGGERAAFRARRGAVRGSRGKKIYAITPAGGRLFDQLMTGEGRSAQDDRGFLVRLAFACHMAPEARLGLLERRRALLVERLVRARLGATSGRRRLDAYAVSLIEHGTETTERDISWLDRLIDAEHATERAAEHAAGHAMTERDDP